MLKVLEKLRRICAKSSRQSEKFAIDEILSRHFRKSEFACKCGCGFDDVDPALIDLLEEVRSYFGNRPVRVLSGCRCESHNKTVGGSAKSQHLLGKACDFYIEGVESLFTTAYLRDRYPTSLGIGEYSSFTHVDVRSEKARWSV